MIEWFMWVEVAVACLAGILCLVLGFMGRLPNDLTLAALAVVELFLVAQVVVGIVAPLVGNAPHGSLLEYYVYIVFALVIPPLAQFWSLVERTKWSTVVLGVACLAVAIMLYRMYQIWAVQVA